MADRDFIDEILDFDDHPAFFGSRSTDIIKNWLKTDDGGVFLQDIINSDAEPPMKRL